MHHLTRTRRAVVALVAAIVLSLVGLTPATGVGDAVLSGTVVPPPGVPTAAGATVHVYEPDNPWPRTSAPVGADGAFTAGGLVTGAGYELRLGWPDKAVLTGYYEGDALPLTPQHSYARPVAPGERPVLRPRAAAAMSGVLDLSDAPGVAPTEVTVHAAASPAHNVWSASEVSTTVDADGTFVLDGLDPTATYRLGWSGQGIPTGYFSGGVAVSDDPTPIPPRSGVVLPVGHYVPITGRVELPEGVSWDATAMDLRVGDLWTPVDDGRFTQERVPSWATATLEVADTSGLLEPGYLASPEGTTTPDRVRAWRIPAGSDITVRPAAMAAISGRVISGVSAGSLIAVCSAPYANCFEPVPVAEDGSFEARGLVPGVSHVVQLISPDLAEGFVDGSGELVTEQEDALVFRPPAHGIEVPGLTEAGISVRLAAPAGGNGFWCVTAIDARDLERARSCVQREDSLEVRGLGAGREYRLRVDGAVAPGWYVDDDGPLALEESAARPVASGATVLVNPSPPASLTGTVTGDGVQGVGGVADLTLLDSVDGRTVYRTQVYTASPFRASLPAGTFVVGVNAGPNPVPRPAQYHVAEGLSTARWQDATPVTLTAGETTELALLVGGSCATFEGRLDLPLTEHDRVEVRLWSDDPRLPPRTWTTFYGDLDFAVEGLVPGTYHVRVSALDGAWPPRSFDDVTITGCERVSGVHLGDEPVVALPRVWLDGGGAPGVPVTVRSTTSSVVPDEIRYEWYRDDVPVAGATGPEYTPGPGHVPSRLGVRVTPVKAGYRSRSTTKTWEMGSPGVLTGLTAKVEGTARQGQPLTASGGGWPADATVTWRWARDGWTIRSATGPTYVVGESDEGSTLTATATVVVEGFRPATVSASVVAGYWTFRALAEPVLPEQVRVGVAVRPSAPVWSTPPDTSATTWLRDGKAIAGATGPTYTPVAADVGTRLAVRVTGTQGAVRRTTTSPSVLVQEGVLKPTAGPSVTGVARVGAKLRTDGGRWPSGVTLTYRWFRGATAIPDATGSTYVLTPADHKARMSVQVTARKPGYTAVSRTSSAVGPVEKGRFELVSAPRITGRTVLGQTLRASRGTWSTTPASVAYQWYRDGSPVAGARSSSYGLGTADVGKRISVRVTVAAPAYVSASAASARTTLVVGATPKVSLSLSPTTVARGGRVTARVALTLPESVTQTSGTVVLSVGRYTFRYPTTGRVTSRDIRIDDTGAFPVRATFWPQSRYLVKSSSSTVTLRVT
ncbi:hypothetical protein [Cellulomonas uda]|uniref:Uncharacterized protein n=1 Tax=Cellulomonas uda TaxID=1714 RepID=A0A4Y3KDK7_CELUD|nr:hypothetical protein [Cellulomonas uda]NII65658.1 hypothetical protein [Cellulomonas uda]GEA81464.1 hypothetical protein CUD01_19080 [Cellulomonas uda]